MNVCFSAAQSVEIAVPNQPVPIQHYLRQPQRLVHALIDPNRVEALGNDQFRFKMRPLHFMTLTLQPTVDLKIWAESEGRIHLQSTGCEILGIEYINQRFGLQLVGELFPITRLSKTYLSGEARLRVEVDMPPPLSFTPRPIVEATGNGLLHSVLLTIKQRLAHQIVADYSEWVSHQAYASSALTDASFCSSNSSAI
ncbi:MAG: DUF1997 domain-containing protein [Elainella sp. Prado103]|jgi:hypothetical protein|nr:DUF1997 domain-containing protein [Elainella sp. Prado103]